MSSFIQSPESPDALKLPSTSRYRATKEPDTLRTTMLGNHTYTPPESSKTTPGPVARHEHQVDEDSESQSAAESQTSNETESSHATDDDNDDLLYILQPRTYTPIPPAPIPSPRVSTVPEPTARLPIPDRGSPHELSIHIEAEEDEPYYSGSDEDHVRETVVQIPARDARRGASTAAQPKVLQIQSLQVKPVQVRNVQRESSQRQSRSCDKQVDLGHKASLRDRISGSQKGEVPKAIHVPPVNAQEFRRQKSARSQGSPQSRRPPHTAGGPETQRHPEAMQRHHTNLDLNPPAFPSLLPSPASERQHFRPVQASPHSPLQQRPHTANTVVGDYSLQHHQQQRQQQYHQRGAPSQMGMSTLSRVMTSGTDNASSTRTVKKKRSAFGWLKKAFSLDEEERAAFEARKRAMPVNYYQPHYGQQGDGHQSPRYLDGKRIA